MSELELTAQPERAHDRNKRRIWVYHTAETKVEYLGHLTISANLAPALVARIEGRASVDEFVDIMQSGAQELCVAKAECDELKAENETLRREVERLHQAMSLCSGSCHAALAALAPTEADERGEG